ncbi:alpha/beta fold hydrolase [Micromonospora musae]|uniref:Alpha/beta fold hydrolase n=1 Tax=Micromonospora musae TaxID=1894970 RepID=A0A3A9Y9G9_9ACTN|nr:alpha/beta fold hydrolase [Micromonospora musae]RKN22385.1 alpha/beta fold hydrolase [Micromonospora musae]RKN34141.1 alpha/beta fold hydrolase [Micromonospora musae]
MERVIAPDGEKIVLHSTGTGPDVVIVHGGGVTVEPYRRLAAALAERCTVHLYNRRGRADAPARREPYSVEQEIEDLGAVLAQTRARAVVGHSSGGFIALRAALTMPIARLALYDPAVSVDGIFKADFIPAARAALRTGDTARALAIVGAAGNPQSLASRLPLAVQTALTRLLLRHPVGREMGELLDMTLYETAEIAAHDGPAEQYAAITADVLFAYGQAGPPHYPRLAASLAPVLPRMRVLPVPRAGHDGINRAPARLVEPLTAFLTAA